MQRIILLTSLILICFNHLQGQSFLTPIPKFKEVWIKTYEGEEGILRNYILGKKKDFDSQKDLRIELCHNFQYINKDGKYKALLKYKIYVGKKLMKTYSLPCIYSEELKEWRMEGMWGLAGDTFREFITSLKTEPFVYLLGDESIPVISFVKKIKEEVWQNDGFNYDAFLHDFIEKWKEENNMSKLDIFLEREIGWTEGNILGFKKGTIIELDNEDFKQDDEK